MTDLQHHYKERSPEETVQLIKQFFLSHDLTLKESDLNMSEAGTWYCRIDLYNEDVRLGGANGKGVTKAYALASGYAELYERFCNKIWFLYSPWWIKDYIKNNQKCYNYTFHPQEKILTKKEVLSNSQRISHYMNHFTQEIPALEDAMLNLIIPDQKYIGVPTININDNNDILYVDPRLLLRVTRSNGMAAGNTIEEALNQGISELIEREVENKFLLSWDSNETQYVRLDLTKIENPILQNIIQQIEALGYQLYLFDLSYTYNMPVIMSLLINPVDNILNINFGSFPVFEIAAERVLTELYQGIYSYKTNDYRLRVQLPQRKMTFTDINNAYGNAIDGQIFPEFLLQSSIIMEQYNKEVFISKEHSNMEILNYFKTFSQTHPGIKFYYMDTSLCDEIKAIHVFLENTEEYSPMSAENSMPIMLNNLIVLETVQTLKRLTKFYEDFYNHNKINIIDFLTIINLQYTANPALHTIIDASLLWNGTFTEGQHQVGWEALSTALNLRDTNSFNGIPADLLDTPILKDYKKYIQLLLYCLCQQYTIEELMEIFNNFYSYNIIEKDIQEVLNIEYLLKKIYIEPMQHYLASEQYQKVFSLYH